MHLTLESNINKRAKPHNAKITLKKARKMALKAILATIPLVYLAR